MSNLVVKMMSGELLPDENKAKGFTLVEAFGQVTCERNAEGKPRIEIPTEDGRLAAYFPEGNTYIIKNVKQLLVFPMKYISMVQPLKELMCCRTI